MMTHGESAAQTRRGILLSNSAASAEQWRSGPYPHLWGNIASKHPPGWVEARERQVGGEKGKKMGGEEWLVGRINATETFMGTECGKLMRGDDAINTHRLAMLRAIICWALKKTTTLSQLSEGRIHTRQTTGWEKKGGLLAIQYPARLHWKKRKKLKNRVLQDRNHKALYSAMHVCITSCRRALWTATVTFLNRTVHVRELF